MEAPNFKTPFNSFPDFKSMVEWKNGLTENQLLYFRNIEKIEATKMKPGSEFVLNEKFKTKHFGLLLLCLEYIYKGCEKMNKVVYDEKTTRIKIL